uniref:Atx10homo_assoc domain-containing protein n=1 Tax=Mesocestoides corti TaxID=53468 RepID=A0A5K3FLT8_MESCO
MVLLAARICGVFESFVIVVSLQRIHPTLLCLSNCRMTEIIRAYAGIDWQIASLAGKVICNFLYFDVDLKVEHKREDLASVKFPAVELLGQEEQAELEALLLDLTDEDLVNSVQGDTRIHGVEGDVSHHCFQRSVWSADFLSVAAHLLAIMNGKA